jgi:hypothetical protein
VFTNALVARGYAFTGEAAKVKRPDYVLTHYSFKPLDTALTSIISLIFAAIVVLRFGFGYFTLDTSIFIAWLGRVL